MEYSVMERIKLALHCKKNIDLAKKIDDAHGVEITQNVHESTISRWDKKGFPKTTETIITLLLDKIDRLNKTISYLEIKNEKDT